MSVVVRMEMPKNRCPVRFSIAANGYCPIEDRSGCGFDVTKERPDWCPILAVLPEKHGELIDRQVVYKKIKWWQENTHDTVTKAMLHEFYLMLFGVPAIVPAERSETDGK